MAVANTKSTIVTNADAAPRTMTDAHLAHGTLREQRAVVEVLAADDNNSVYRLFRVHTSWMISQLLLWNDALTSGTDFEIGAYDTLENGGAVIDSSAWGDAISMASARVVPLDVTFELLNIDKIEKRIWEQLGLATDPRKLVDICLKGVAVGSAAGTIAGICRYTDGS